MVFVGGFLENVQRLPPESDAMGFGQFIEVFDQPIGEFGVAELGWRAQSDVLLESREAVERLVLAVRWRRLHQLFNADFKAGRVSWQFEIIYYRLLIFADHAERRTGFGFPDLGGPGVIEGLSH